MITRLKITALAAGVAFAGIAGASLAGNAANATGLSPTARTCAAFATWNHSKTAAHLNTLMADSIAAPWHVLGTDVVVLYTDVRDHDTYDAPSDAHALVLDCR